MSSSIACCRGPLPEGHPRAGVKYFCIDADVPLLATGLAVTPVLTKYAYTDNEAVLLEAHRAPDEWFAAACKMPNLLVCGDPDAWCPRQSTLFAAELAKQPISRAPALRPHVGLTATITEAMPQCRGQSVILCGSYEVCSSVYAHLRPEGMRVGDGAVDQFGRYTKVHRILSPVSVSIDGGRCVKRLTQLEQHIVVSPSMVRSGEYDTVVILPGVSLLCARAVCRRARYMIIGVGHSPLGYVL